MRRRRRQEPNSCAAHRVPTTAARDLGKENARLERLKKYRCPVKGDHLCSSQFLHFMEFPDHFSQAWQKNLLLLSFS